MGEEMGLLAALDLHKRLQSGIVEECIEVEYQLYSCGEIYSPFLGNREHSMKARYILRDFPFKLFISSVPYQALPQKLCLTFKAPYEVRKDTGRFTSSGIFPEEIAKEFAAFLSLVTRRRVFVGRQIRYNGLPIEQEVDIYKHLHFQEKQRPKEIEPKEIYQLLENLQTMDRRIANSFILAMRLYHSAVEMMYTEPEFSYLFLVTCLEAISSAVYKDYRPNNEEDFLDSRFPGWKASLTPGQRAKLKKVLLTNEKFTFRKLSKFVNENVPERFWSEKEDDAKPDYLTKIIESSGQERISRSDITIQEWEKIEKESLSQVLRDIYTARSKLIHEGIRLPSSIV
ncbi:MAG: hypothetical protein OCU20_01000, partial [Methanophagales archaeon]|nr:hypothetical protein [Methanophagales archaeon]